MKREEALKNQQVRFTRKEAREFAMQTIFQMDAQKELEAESLEKYLGDKKLGTQTAYVKTVLGELLKNIEEIDAKINSVDSGWSTARMAKTDLAIIRIVSLSKLYGAEQSPKFINAVLGKIEKTM